MPESYKSIGKDREVIVRMTENKEHRDAVISGLEANGGHCPCKPVPTEFTRCICKEFRDQIEAGIPGQCHCGLYIITVK